MKKKLLGLLPYLIVLAVDFYLLPLVIRDTGLAILMLLVVVPLVAVITGVLYGVRRGFNLLLPVLAMVLFAPSIFIFYNETAWVYIPFYGIAVLVGNAIGRAFYGKK